MSDKPESLRDQVEAAFETVQEDKAPVEPEEVSDDTAQEEDPIEEIEVEEKTDDTPQEEEIKAPEHWSKDDVEAFKELDPKAQKLYLKRAKEQESHFTKKNQEFAEDKRLAERFRKSIEPFKGYFKQHNIDEFEGFQKAATAHVRLMNASPQEKTQILQQLAIDYGANIAQQNYPHTDVTQLDPAIQNIYEELHKTKQYIAQQEQQRANQEIQSLESKIQSFQNEKNESGDLKYPHFETVRTQMGALMQIGQADSLEAAYKKAIFLNDDLREAHIMSQNKNIEKEVANKLRASSSKKAGFNVKSGSVSQISDPKETLPMRQILERAYDAQKRV